MNNARKPYWKNGLPVGLGLVGAAVAALLLVVLLLGFVFYALQRSSAAHESGEKYSRAGARTVMLSGADGRTAKPALDGL